MLAKSQTNKIIQKGNQKPTKPKQDLPCDFKIKNQIEYELQKVNQSKNT